MTYSIEDQKIRKEIMQCLVRFEFTTLEALDKLIDTNKPLMFDTETIGLYGRIRLAQFFQEGWDCAYLVEWPEPMRLVSVLSKQHVVMHNSHYDISTIQEQLGKTTWMPENFDDTFLLARLHFYTQESFSLDNVIKYCTGTNPYITDEQKANWNVPVLSDNQLLYAATDVVYLQQVYDIVKEQKDNINYKLDMLTVEYCLDFQNNGMPIDKNKLQERYAENMKRINEIGLKINCNSYQQVRAYINSVLSDDNGLAVLSAKGDKKAIDVRETRKLTKNNSFLTKFMQTMEETSPSYGNIYGKFKCSARSGRTTSDDQNLQQIPRSLKGVFGVDPEGDEVILFSDFAQIQLRGVCVVTGDKTMERLFREGKDMHNFVAEMIFGENFTKEHRQISKTANFGLLFGAGVVVFISILVKQAGLYLSEQEAMNIKKKWINLWKEISAWQTAGIRSWKKKEAWETPLGRRYTAKMMTDQLAMQIQGFEAEVAKLAMHYMIPKLKALHPSIKLRNFIHDSYIFTCERNPEVYEPACVIIAESMQEAWKEMCQSVLITDLPMPTKVRVGYNWGDIEKDEFIHELVRA